MRSGWARERGTGKSIEKLRTSRTEAPERKTVSAHIDPLGKKSGKRRAS